MAYVAAILLAHFFFLLLSLITPNVELYSLSIVGNCMVLSRIVGYETLEDIFHKPPVCIVGPMAEDISL